MLAASVGVHLVSDVPERMATWPVPTLIDAKRKRVIDAVRERGILFVHVPKNAGTSICERLYGLQVKHSTVTYYESVAPDLLDLPSFAVLRDPVERFISAFQYACAGGTCDRRVSPAFRRCYTGFEGVDCAIRHMERGRDFFAMDHVFRPQSWYVTRRDGRVGVDHLIRYEALDRLHTFAGLETLTGIPRLNSGRHHPQMLTPRQQAFLREFYSDDYALLERAAH